MTIFILSNALVIYSSLHRNISWLMKLLNCSLLVFIIASYYTNARFISGSIIDHRVLPQFVCKIVNVQLRLCAQIGIEIVLQLSSERWKCSVVIVSAICSIPQQSSAYLRSVVPFKRYTATTTQDIAPGAILSNIRVLCELYFIPYSPYVRLKKTLPNVKIIAEWKNRCFRTCTYHQ